MVDLVGVPGSGFWTGPVLAVVSMWVSEPVDGRNLLVLLSLHPTLQIHQSILFFLMFYFIDFLRRMLWSKMRDFAIVPHLETNIYYRPDRGLH